MSARAWSATLQRTSVETTASNEKSANGSSSARLHHLDGDARLRKLLLELPAHVAVRLHRHDAGGTLVVVEVGPGAGAELEHLALEACEEGATPLAQAGSLDSLDRALVDQRPGGP